MSAPRPRTFVAGTVDDATLCRSGAEVVRIEARALTDLLPRIDGAFAAACRAMLECHGRVVVTGMGKSGHVARKIAATFASAGTPAFFLHPGEASHGDLGMITGDDVVLALSNSGETAEVVTIVPMIKRLGAFLVAMTGRPDSRLARDADVHVDVSVAREACPLGLAPTASTTASLAMGDAMAIALLEARGFTAEDFARSHPGGSLGRRLLVHVADIMHGGDGVPRVTATEPVSRALVEMTRTKLGMAVVVDAHDRVVGVFTDGDLRRALGRGIDVHTVAVSAVMTADCVTVSPRMLAAEAVGIMERKKVSAIPVVEDGRVVGAFNVQDLLRAGVF
ncbi:MAG: KpsF/GutQ family sugar-phosphate isomerase [Ectothiorhodospiraceae bacterium]|nr:KpsF/GutQ family sugar-phosphate isomerase [Chromatiales bacterium]MCP5157583.1 KpsF/GutQ family sugar-phosphate isomerase [Ectothiorhodospiraceae bacterium]